MRRSDSGVGDSGALRIGVGRSMIDGDAIWQRWEAVGSKLDERGRRLFAAAEARTAGWGGLAMVSQITGLARSTINRGEDDLDAEPLPKGQVRRAGGGRRREAAGGADHRAAARIQISDIVNDIPRRTGGPHQTKHLPKAQSSPSWFPLRDPMIVTAALS
jgi:hypothetical protein